MKLGFSTNAFVNYSVTYAIESISSMGYDGIEIVLDLPHAYLPISKTQQNEIKLSLKNNNLLVSNLNANTVFGRNKNPENKFEPSLSNENEKLRKWRINYSKQAIDLAVFLDSPSISITSGINDNQNNSLCLNLLKNSLTEIAEYAEKNDILVGIEYEPGLLIDNSDKVLNILSNDFENIGLNLDTCHACVINENISKIISTFDKKIIHTHISDCKNNIHYHLLPGEGEINFKQMIDSLNQTNYSGFLTAELYTYANIPIEAASKAFNYLRNLTK